MGRQWVDGYSSDVEVYLLLEDGRRLEVAQIGNGCLFLRQPSALPQMCGSVIIKVDGQERDINVLLYKGADPKDPCVPYEKRFFHQQIDVGAQPCR
jgi:hypothetical protein